MGLILTSPASAGLISSDICAGAAYCNGEVSGNILGWTINNGFAVSDSFTLGSGGTVNMVSFGAWDSTEETGGTVDWNILSGGPDTSAGGSVVAFGTGATLSTEDLGINTDGYDVVVDSFTLSAPLTAGTYYLELQNATVPSGGYFYWDENDGPSGDGSGSIAWESGGYLAATNNCLSSGTELESGYCSESFAVYTTTGTAPEPGTLALGGAGLLLLAGIVRRKRNRIQ